jgi:hypothetical protein
MFVIFGAKTVKTLVKSGVIVRRRCDKCHYLSDLLEHIFRQYFTLFFIPVFPISKGNSLLVCNRCKAAFYIQGEDYLATEGKKSVHSSGDTTLGSTPETEKMIITCGVCRGLLRVPVMTGHRLLVTCPHCNRKFEV